MYTRIVSMRLKPNGRSQFSRVIENNVLPLLRKQKGFQDEIVLVATDGIEAIGISFWDNKENADTYQRSSYSAVMGILQNLLEGIPQIRAYEVSNATANLVPVHAA